MCRDRPLIARIRVVVLLLLFLPLSVARAASTPDEPVLQSPANAATGVSSPVTLDVLVSDSAGGDLNVTFYSGAVSRSDVPDFTIVVLPDTQKYSTSYPATFKAQTKWIVDHRIADNIVYVAHEGDITDDGDQKESEWINAAAAMELLEDPATTIAPDGVPFGMAVGNNDQTPNGSPSGTNLFNKYFGILHFQGRGYYGGYYGSKNDNHYDLFSVGPTGFVVVYIGYGAYKNSGVLTWADGVLRNYSDRRGIVVSHSLIGTSGSFSSEGQAIYSALKDNPNLFVMLCGHVGGEARRQDTYDGSTVNTLLSDFQGRSNGGDGWMRILQFSPAINSIKVRTYSPTLNKYETDSNSEFSLAYEASSPAASVIATTTVHSGSHATTVWDGLASGKTYQWSVSVSNGTQTTVSPTWTFTTAAATANAAPVAHSQSKTTVANTAVNLTLTGTDPEGQQLTYLIVSQPAHGLLSGAPPNVMYAPPADYVGSDSFTFKVNDGQLDSNVATVGITVTASAPTPPPVNDNFSSALTLQLPSSVAEVTTVATTEPTDPAPTCGNGSAARSVWFQHTAGKSGLLFVDTLGSDYDTIVNVYTGIPGSFIVKACNDNAPGMIQSKAGFVALSGTTYFIEVTSASGNGGNLNLHLKAPEMKTSSTSLSFSGQFPGTTSSYKTVAVTNTGTEILGNLSISASANFSVTSDGCAGASLAPAATCNIAVAFSPSNIGSIKGGLTIASAANNSPLVVSLSGTGLAALTFSSSSLSFGTVAVNGTSSAKTSTLTNNTPNAIAISDISISGGFSATHNCGSALPAVLQPKGSCTLTVYFTPKRSGSVNGAVSITSTADGSPHVLNLSGTGSGSVSVKLSLSPSSLSFSGTRVGATSTSKTVTVRNGGTSVVAVYALRISANFAINSDGCSGKTLDAGQSCSFAVVLQPTAIASDIHGAVTIASSSDPLLIESLSGKGIGPVTFSSSSLSFGSVPYDTSSSVKTVTVENNQDTELRLDGISLSGNYTRAAGNSAGTCNPGVPLPPKGSCTVGILFHPTRTGSINGGLAMFAGALGSPHVLPLSGSGT